MPAGLARPRRSGATADEAFFVGTAAEVTPIRTVDKVTIGSGRRGPITEAVQKRFFQLINGEVPDVHGWLTFVYPNEARSAKPVAAANTPAHAR